MRGDQPRLRARLPDWKARGHEIERNAADFEAALPALDAEARAWLREALATAHPANAWEERL